MEDFNKERRLRPRRPRISGEHGQYSSQQRSQGSRGEGRHEERRPQRAWGEERPERRSFAQRDRAYSSSRPQRSHESGDYSQHRSRGYENSGRRSYSSSEAPRRRSSGYDAERRDSAYEHSERRSSGYNAPERRNSAYESSERRPRSYSSDRRPAGPGRRPAPFRGRKAHDGASEGIERMVSRKPQVDQLQYSDNDNVKTPISEVVRLNKFIANSGICSRREADQMIEAGVVTVNGEVVTELGTKVNVLSDEVRFNGELLRGEEKVYIVMNKPKGYVTTAGDPHADKTVMDLLKGCPSRVFPVGRLDKNTTGVLMFTNDGEIAERLTHPSYDKKKIYQVTLDHPLSQEDFDAVLSGIELGDGMIKADELEFIDAEDHRKLGIEIHSGKNRIVRRIFESLGYDVKALDRVYFAGLTKKGIKKGEWRYLSRGEANVLKMGAYV